MPILSFFRRRGDSNEDRSSSNNNTRGRGFSWWIRRRPANGTFFFGICDFRISTIFLNVFHIVFTLLLWALGFVNISNDWKHLVASVSFSLLGILGALYANLTLTAISTIGLSFLIGFYFMVMYLPGFITLVLIVLSQAVLIYEIREGYIFKETIDDDNLISKESSEIMENAKYMASDIVGLGEP
jgi:diacylglycerol kinase